MILYLFTFLVTLPDAFYKLKQPFNNIRKQNETVKLYLKVICIAALSLAIVYLAEWNIKHELNI